MRLTEIARRAAGRSPAFLFRRGVREVRQRLASPIQRRRLASLTPDAAARQLGVASLEAAWDAQGARPYRPDEDERGRLHRLYSGPFRAERESLEGAAGQVLAHEFDLLGSGPVALGPDLDWQLDFKSGRRWELAPSERIDCADMGRASDVKVPWELSRGQHLTTLARAWIVTGDPRYPAEFEREIRSWIEHNPPGFGVNWACTMDVALRATSWIWALGLFEGAAFSEGFRERILLSLYQHGLWIPEHLETSDVNGNHFLSDALGIVALGAAFAKTRAGQTWLARGRDILEREACLQIEEDGVGIEGSVPYHRLVLEIFLVGSRLLEAAGLPASGGFRRRLAGMFDFVDAYTTPEGLSPVVGDADDGRALVLGRTDPRDHRYLLSTGAVLYGRGDWKARAGRFWEDSLWLLGSAGRTAFDALPEAAPANTSRAFPRSGYYVLRSDAQYLFVDAAPVGFRGRGGHGHNDVLAFEWHAGGRPLVTDSGAYVYTASAEWRNRMRSTALHNTVRIDGEEINRFVAPEALWTLRDDAQPVRVRFESTPESETLVAGHTGYERLPAPLTVVRRFELDSRSLRLLLTDSFEGEGEHLFEFFFHAAPGAQARSFSAEGVEFAWNGARVRLRQVSGPAAAWELGQGWFSPSYGVRIARPFTKAFLTARAPVSLSWSLEAELAGSG